MSGGDPGQMNPGSYFSQGPPQDSDPRFYNQAPGGGQEWFNQQPGGGQPMFLNPTDFQKSQPAVYHPFTPGEPPPPQGAVIPGGPEGQQLPNKGYTTLPEAQQRYGQPFHSGGQYPGDQWNSVQQNNGVPKQQFGQPLNGTNHMDPTSDNPQPWNPVQDPGQQPLGNYYQVQTPGDQGGIYQPYEKNNQQQQQDQAGTASLNYGEYAYSDDNDSHKGFGSFFHGDESDVLASSGTPSLSASERQTPDHVPDPTVVDDPNQSVPPHSGIEQVKDHIRDGPPVHGQPDQYFANQQEQITCGPSEPPISHHPGVAFNQGHTGDQIPILNPENRISGHDEVVHNTNLADSQMANQGFSEPIQNQGDGTNTAGDQPLPPFTFGLPHQLGIPPDQPNSNFVGTRHDAAPVPSPSTPSSQGGHPSASSDSAALEKAGQPGFQIQRSPSIGEDQLSTHSQGSSVLGGSVGSQSQPPSTSTSRSNSMLGEQPGSGHPSLSPVFRDPSLGSGSPREAGDSSGELQGTLGQGAAHEQAEQSGTHETAGAPDPQSAASTEQAWTNQNSSSVTTLYHVQQNDSNPAVRSLENNQQTQVQQAAPEVTIPNPNFGQGMQFQQDNQPVNAEKPIQQTQYEPPVSQAYGPASVASDVNLTSSSQPEVSTQDPKLSQSTAHAANTPTSLPPTDLPKLPASHVQSIIPQGPKELSPTDEKTLSTHPSAFRSVQRGNPAQLTSVNPSPPLWSTEVPPMPANILLAPAAPPTASLVPPVRLAAPQETASAGLAASVASVSVPSLPVEAVSLLTQPQVNPTRPNLGQPASASNSNMCHSNVSSGTSSSTAQAPSIANVTENLSDLNLGPARNPLLTQPIPPVPVQPTLQTSPSAPVANKVTESLTLAASAPALALPAATASASVASSVQTPASSVQNRIPFAHTPEGTLEASQTVPVQNQTGAAPQHQQLQQQQQQQQQQQPLQQPALSVDCQQAQPLQQQQQPPLHHSQVYAQPQDQQGQFQQQQGQPLSNQSYDRRTSGPYYDRQYHDQWYQYDYRSQQYDYYARQAAYDRQRGYGYRGSGYDVNSSYSRQGYTNRERPRSRQGYPDRERPRSRQGYQDQSQQGAPTDQENRQRPRSRQERGYGADAYNRGYDRRDPRAQDYYKGYDAYGRHYDRQAQEYWAKQGYYGNRSYDDRYQNWERQKQYYRDRQEESQRQNISAPEQHLAAETQTGRGDYQGNQGDTRFASEFHHQGGDTPEKYSADQSSIYAQDYANQNASSNVLYQDQYGNSYGYGDVTDGVYQEVKQVTPPPPERLTPAKFALPHVVARFSPGGHLIKVLPNMPQDGMPAVVEIHNVETMLEHTDEAVELRAFPGPLIKGETHKGDVISFSQRKSSMCRNSTDMMDRESASLLWDLMELVCRQNGNIMESDVSDLLLKNHPMVSSSTTTASQADGDMPAEEETNSEDRRSAVTTQKKPHLRDVESDTNRFRELLLFGRKKDALEAAIRAGLWGHALLLACKMDSRTHTSVMTRFANSLPMNDPLQTLYQLMSNRQPAAVTSCADEKWGDWRPHLAMILSNLSQDSELDVKSIITLGDSLASRGLLKASHFVYLMAQVGFGVYSKKTTKMVLLGASHSLPFKSFALNECIQQTEIYEYAQLLCNKHYTLPNYQPYKFIYASRLAEHGFTAQALSYCEVVANAVLYMPNLYSSTLVNQICQLANRLVYHDERHFDGRDVAVPEWLNNLQEILNQMNEGQILPSSSSGTPMPWVESYTNLSTMGESVDSNGPTFEVSNTEGKDAAVGDYTLTASGYYQQAAPAAGSTNDSIPNQHTAHSYDQQQHLPQEDAIAATQHSGNYTTFGQQHQPLSALPQHLDPGASLNSNYSEYSTTSATSAGDSGTEFEESGASKAAFDYYAANARSGSFSQFGQKQADGPPSPTDTLTPPATPGGRSRNYSSGSTKYPQGEEKSEAKAEAKEKPKEKPKAKQGGGRGWFGGFFSKVVGRGNQVHLPDDNDKSIQWDEKKRKWVDLNADEDEQEAAPAAPPTDKELHSSASQSAEPRGGGIPRGPSGPPASGDNKFRKPARRNYVDVFQGSAKPATIAASQPPSSLFQTLPTGPPSTNMNFFVPAPVTDDNTDPDQQPQIGNPSSRSQTPASPASHGSQSATYQQHQQQQFFNPNSFSNNANSSITAPTDQQQFQQSPYQQAQAMFQVNNTQPTQSQQEENTVQEEPDGQPLQPSQPQQPPSQPAGPMFFNPQAMPSQIGGVTMPPSGPARGTTSSGRRGYGSRRQYPTTR